MPVPVISISKLSLVKLGLHLTDSINYQLSPEELVHDSLRNKEGVLSESGALVIRTGEFTGRSPKDRYIVKDGITSDAIHWNDFNQPLSEDHYDYIFDEITAYLNKRRELWVRDAYVCADQRFRLNLRVVNELASGNLFAYNMFLRPHEEELDRFAPDWHILCAPGCKLDPSKSGTRQSNAVVVSFQHRTILIAGTGYTGEMKKSVFSILNFLLPHQYQVLSMHCSANMGADGDTAIFFGLSGTGKTTLSADPGRKLIGDDEHGWTSDNVFNFEGGCYAKCIHLNEDKEPEIYRAIRPGALVENTAFFPGTDQIDFEDGSITENTRVSYPLAYISNAQEPSVGNIPGNIFFLTCDAYGVLPPISKLTPAQAMYQFISGYTAKVAGTETGITEPKPTFSACFGAPFLPLHPGRYAELLGKKLKQHGVNVWMINTGWSAGPFGKGHRMKLSYTRAMITAALEGRLDAVEYHKHPVFGMEMPVSCPGVPDSILDPRETWADKVAYDKMAAEVARWFVDNFAKYADGVSAEILSAAPLVSQS